MTPQNFKTILRHSAKKVPKGTEHERRQDHQRFADQGKQTGKLTTKEITDVLKI